MDKLSGLHFQRVTVAGQVWDKKVFVLIDHGLGSEDLGYMSRVIKIFSEEDARALYDEIGQVVAGAGVEPAVTDYETGVLPLHYPATGVLQHADKQTDKNNDKDNDDD